MRSKHIDDGGPAFPQPYPPQAFQKVMATLTFVSRSIKRYEIASAAPM